MNCLFTIAKPDEPTWLYCEFGCGIRIPSRLADKSVICRCPKTPHTGPSFEPGTELENLIAYLGFDESIGCGCRAEIARMNAIGPVRCREQIEAIVKKLESNAKLQSWWMLAAAAAKAAAIGVFSIRGLVERAIENSQKDPSETGAR